MTLATVQQPTLFDTPSTALDLPLKWAGGKRWQLPYLRPIWEPHAHRHFVEPFCGGLAVALGLRPSTALLNDANPHLVNFYHWLQRGLTTDLPMAYDESLFYQYRERFNQLTTHGGTESADAAVLFYFLNRTCFNGLCRFNRNGAFNVPFGRYARIDYRRDFTAYRDTFKPWTFSRLDFAAVSVKPGDFVYADPPYDDTFTAYESTWRGWSDQLRLATWLAAHPGPVVASNQATDRIINL